MKRWLPLLAFLLFVPLMVFSQAGLYDDLKKNDLDGVKAKLQALGTDFKGLPIISWYLANVPQFDSTVFQFLLDHGADINLADNDGLPPIWIALQKATSTAECVLQAKPKLDISCYSDSIDINFFFDTSDLLGSGLSVHYPLVLRAIGANNYDIVDLLIKAGMPLDGAVFETHKNSKTGKQVTTKSTRKPVEFGNSEQVLGRNSPNH